MSPLSTVHRIALLSSFLLVSACGSYDAISQKGKIDYKTTAQSKPLDIPPDLTSVTADERFVVPDVGSKGVATASGMNAGSATTVSTPSGPVVLAQATQARIERSGNQRWLVVNRPAEQVWPVVREFWLQSGFVLKEDKPEIGILETDWAENRAKIPLDGVRKLVGKVFDGLYSSDELDRYRTRIERVDGGTEIYISHRGLREVYADSSQVRTVWTPRASEPELEIEFLNKLLARFAGEETKKVAETKSLAAGTSAAGAEDDSRARIVRVGNERRLQVREGFDRTWRRVGLSLDRIGFTVEDRDRSKGIYFVQYREAGDKLAKKDDKKDDGKPGFFSRMLSFGKTANAGTPIPEDDGRIEGRYRIRVAVVEGRSEISVLNADGQTVSPGTAERVLGMLQSELR